MVGVPVVVAAGAGAGEGAGADVRAGTGFVITLSGLAVKITLSRHRDTIVTPSVHVAFSIKSLVLCTPNCADELPPKVEERPPPLGFCAMITITNNILAMIIKIMKSVNIVFIFSFTY